MELRVRRLWRCGAATKRTIQFIGFLAALGAAVKAIFEAKRHAPRVP
jgi:hypothetical protein